jgi:demethylphylloquinone reductase
MSLTSFAKLLFASAIMFQLTVKSLKQCSRRSPAFSTHCLFSSPSAEYDTAPTSKICIVGGGFAGVYTALKLSNSLTNKDKVEITLIDPKDKFVFLPLLYELAVGSASVSEVAPQYDSLFKNSRVKFIQGSVSDINFDQNEVKLSDTSEGAIKYDQLVMAVGAQPRIDMVPGAKENAMSFYRVEDAFELRLRLKELLDSGKPVIRAVVLGGGYSGVEVATNIAEYVGKDKAVVSIIDRNEQILKSSPVNNRVSSEKALAALGVSINVNTTATKISESTVQLKVSTGEEFEMPADIVIVTVGMEQSQLVKDMSALKREKFGRIAVSRALQSKDRPNVFSLGDCSGIEGELVPSTAQVAMQQSDIVTKNLLYRINNYNKDEIITLKSKPDELDKFRYVPLGEMLTLGNTNAAVTSLNGLVQLQGPLAAVARRLVYAVRMPTPGQQVNALFSAARSQATKARETAIKSRGKARN